MAKWQDGWRGPDWGIVDAPGEKFRGTRGNDHLVGTSQADIFHIGQGGDDSVQAGQGHDTIYAGASLTAEDRIDGGTGLDTLDLHGDYSTGLTLQAATISRIEIMNLTGAFGYSITLASDMRHDKSFFQVDASTAQSLHLDASAMNFSLNAFGSSGDDVIVGGRGINSFSPEGGHDIMTGGPGLDEYFFYSTADSLPSNGDVITNFSASQDLINLALIDADPEKPGVQAFHLGATPQHTGDIVLTYDAGQNVTFVNIYTDKDAHPDMVIQLTGDHTNLTQNNFLL